MAMFQPQHCGLFFTSTHIENAKAARAAAPLDAAWRTLEEGRQLDLLALAQWSGLLHSFYGNTEAADRCINLLASGDVRPAGNAPYFDAVSALVTEIQCFEMVRARAPEAMRAAWLADLAARVGAFNAPAGPLAYHERVWLNLLNLAAGVALEDASLFGESVAAFGTVIADDLHPEGYIPLAVKGEDGEGLFRLLLAVAGLVLTAEAGTHAGADLWAVEARGVSVMTPIPYILYYYYYPEKWRWDPTWPDVETAQSFYRRHAGFWEIVYRHGRSRDVKLLLDELRPIHDVRGGGLTTLTHGVVEEQRRRGLFG